MFQGVAGRDGAAVSEARRASDYVTRREFRDALSDVDEQFDELRVGQMTLDGLMERLLPAIATIIEEKLAPIREALGPTSLTPIGDETSNGHG